MDYETALKTCSNEVQAAIKWLEEHVRFDKGKWEISRRSKAKYLCRDALEFYVLSKVNSPLVKEFLEASKIDAFWLDEKGPEGFDDLLLECSYLLWCLSKMGLNSNDYFEEALESSIKERQTVKGKISSSEFPHTGPMRVLVAVEPDSKVTNMAVRYFLDDLEEFKGFYCV